MIAYDKQNTVFAMREGAELLVHDGESEGPLWRKTLDGTIVGVGADKERVTAITASGTVASFPSRSGADMQSAALGGDTKFAVVGSGKRRVVAALAGKVVALEGNLPVTLVEKAARAVAVAVDDTVLVATQDNELVVIAADGKVTTTPHELGEVSALAWHPENFWVIAATKKVWRWSGTGDPMHITNMPSDLTIRHVAACKQAISIAYDADDGMGVATLAWPSKDTLATLDYPERKVDGLSFGPWPWLAIELDLGDANKQNVLDPSRLHRSDTHPGREHHSWLVAVGGGSAPGPKPAAAAAPASAPAYAPPPSMETRSEFPWRIVALIAFAILALIRFATR